jgi:ribonuclease P protein component
MRLTRRGFEEAQGLSRIHTPHFSISYKNGVSTGGSAVVVPKRVIKGAVQRHLLKRRVKAVLRPYSSPSRVLVISAKKGADTLSFDELSRELSSQLEAILAK